MIELILDKRKRHIGRHGWSIPFLDHMGPVDLPKGLSARDADVLPHPHIGTLHLVRCKFFAPGLMGGYHVFG